MRKTRMIWTCLCLPLLLLRGTPDTYQEHVRMFRALFARGQFRPALEELEVVRKWKRDPESVVLLDMGVIHLRLRHPDQALRDCGDALNLLPTGDQERKLKKCQEMARALREGQAFPSDLRPRMVRIGKGEFSMGSPPGEKWRMDDEKQHRVEISRDFEMAESEVTQGQYGRVMGKNPSDQKDREDLPVEMVTWRDAVEYANRLSEKEGIEPCYRIEGERITWPKGPACTGYRLPTEAEWEYAARGRGKNDFLYAGSNNPKEIAWYIDNSESKPHPVKGKRPNQIGLYDMCGNVREWVWDFYEKEYSGLRDPIGPKSGSGHALRGGSWGFEASYLRVTTRAKRPPSYRTPFLGFRIARSLP